MDGPSHLVHELAYSQPKRRHPRAIFSVPLHIRRLTPGNACNTRGVSLDISEGGMGALVQNELTVGEVVGIDLEVQGRRFNTVVIVRHNSKSRSGLEFLSLTPQQRLQLSELVEVSQMNSRFGSA